MKKKAIIKKEPKQKPKKRKLKLKPIIPKYLQILESIQEIPVIIAMIILVVTKGIVLNKFIKGNTWNESLELTFSYMMFYFIVMLFIKVFINFRKSSIEER